MSRILRLQALASEASLKPAESSVSAGLCSTASAGLCSTVSAGLCQVEA